MGVLFMMPNWQAPSEVWLQRMMEELEGDLTAVVARDTGGATLWRENTPAISLRPRSMFARIYYRNINRHIPHSMPFAHRTLLKEIERPGATRVLCHYGTFAANFMEVWDKTDIPLYIHFHGFDATFDLRSYERPERRHFSDAYLLKILKLAQRSRFIANSKFTKSLLTEAGLPSDRIFIKYYGVPTPPTFKRHEDQKEVTVLHLGRLVDFKSPDRTIRAFEIARSKGMRGKLILAGDGPLREKCEQLKAVSPYRDSIHMPGVVSEGQARTLLWNSDIYTQHNVRGEISRQTECLGVSVVEAMAAGLPVVGTRSGGVKETVIDGETGMLLDPGDIEGQADAIFRLAGDFALRQKLGSAGHRRAATNFNIEQEARELRTIMKL